MTVALWARLDSLQWSRGLSTAEGASASLPARPSCPSANSGVEQVLAHSDRIHKRRLWGHEAPEEVEHIGLALLELPLAAGPSALLP